MMHQDTDRVRRALTQAMAAGVLTGDAAAQAQRCLDRLDQPLRIGLLGKRGSGKTTLLHLLAGQEVVPAGAVVPTLELGYGAAPQMVCTLADGSRTTPDHADPGRIAELAPVFVALRMPLLALAKISVLEVVSPDDPTALHRASQWAAKRCDVMIWCTQSFDAPDQQIWAQMPDTIKDHGFLVVTKADELRATGLLDAVMAQADVMGHEDFCAVMAVTATQALAARRPDGSVDKDLMRESGGTALIAAIRKQISASRQAVIDTADVLLAQVAAPATPAPGTAMPPQLDAVCAETVTRITRLGAVLSDLHTGAGAAAHARIIAETAAVLQQLCDALSEIPGDAGSAVAHLRALAFDAADLVQLMQMEKHGSAAGDAVSLLLQVKHDLQAQRAA